MLKRLFDFVVALVGLLLFGWFLLLTFIIVSVNCRCNGIFRQQRVGRHGKLFTIYKFRTMQRANHIDRFSRFLRESKIDELPQFWNVLKGDMSLVGPRPDLPGYYDLLQGEERKVLELRPGITSPASIKYKDEEALLAMQPDPNQYNDSVIFPDKVRMNLEYYYTRSFWGDLRILWRTVVGG